MLFHLCIVIFMQRLQRNIGETKKIFCFLDPITVSEVASIKEFTNLFMKKVIYKCFDECTFFFFFFHQKAISSPSFYQKAGL